MTMRILLQSWDIHLVAGAHTDYMDHRTDEMVHRGMIWQGGTAYHSNFLIVTMRVPLRSWDIHPVSETHTDYLDHRTGEMVYHGMIWTAESSILMTITHNSSCTFIGHMGPWLLWDLRYWIWRRETSLGSQNIMHTCFLFSHRLIRVYPHPPPNYSPPCRMNGIK